MDQIIKDLIVTPLKQINHLKGDIYHGMKKSDSGFYGFGEAYFSTIVKDEIKGWKKHTKMVLNLIVPIGEIEFVIYDDRVESTTFNNFFTIRLSQENYKRLTIPFGVWMSFKGIGEGTNMLLNIASIEHDPSEALTKEFDEIKYDWIK